MQLSDFSNGATSGLANLLQIVGFVGSLVGFGLSIWFSYKSKRASEQAKEAAEAARQRLLQVGSLMDFESTKAKIQETMRLFRVSAFVVGLDRLTVVRGELHKLREVWPDQSDDELSTLQQSITLVTSAMNKVELALQKQKTVEEFARINSSLAQVDDLLSKLQPRLKNEVAR